MGISSREYMQLVSRYRSGDLLEDEKEISIRFEGGAVAASCSSVVDVYRISRREIKRQFINMNALLVVGKMV
jgi:hypothetical protein